MNVHRVTKVMAVVGTRPEAIKMAPVIHELRRHPDAFSVFVCATGQHRELLTRALDMMRVPVDRNLNVMVHDQSLSGLTARLFDALDPLVEAEQPAWLLVQGDTTSAMVAGLVAFYRKVRLGHVEAGLRTDDLHQPFPEELNRRVADLCSDACFAPTDLAKDHLLREGVSPARVHLTGNTIVDAVLDISARPYDETTGPLTGVPRGPRWVLVTTHRRENFGAPLDRICDAVAAIANAHGESIHVIVPVHPNPNVGEKVRKRLALPNCSIVSALDYPDFVHVLSRASLALTDSGGVQEEAPTFGVPVLVLREKTERPEGVTAGVARLVGTDTATIISEAARILAAGRPRTPAKNPYGDGHASRRIVEILRSVS
jgi:UDP-N-acetylglucosamine 2-epimerase (non-hydrolysing)